MGSFSPCEAQWDLKIKIFGPEKSGGHLHFLKKVNVVKWEVKVLVVDTDSKLKETKKTGYGIPKLHFLCFAFTLAM